MVAITVKPTLHRFASCEEFVRAFALNEQDLILTHEHVYTPCFGGLELPCRVLFQERYGTGEPTDAMADAILRDAGEVRGRVVAMGGGTVLDLGKLLAVAGTGGVDALYEAAPALEKTRELLAVPTTCGTGSEVTNISILNRTRLGTKMGLVSPALYPDHAVLIPQLLEGMPFSVFATSSIDALVHAVESTLSPKATPYTKLFGYKAMEMILSGYREIGEKGPQARLPLLEDFLIASNYAGLAFGTAGCGPVHALSYPLGGAYHVAHGESNYALFTGVLKHYLQARPQGELLVLNHRLARLLDCESAQVYDALEALLDRILPKKPLRAYGVTREDIPLFARSVMEGQQRLLANSFVPLDEAQVAKIYSDLW